MTPEEIAKIDLNTPAFGPESEVKKVDPAVVEPTEEVPVESVEENKVPYARFKKFHDEAIRLREEAEEWRRKAETREEKKEEVEVPAHWIKLYGDSPESLEAWKIKNEQDEALIQKARQEAINAVKEERLREIETTEKNMEFIDREIGTLKEYIGRELTEKEQEAILDIVDEFTPKDEDGNYAGALVPMDKAWEVYQLRNSGSPKKVARDNVASLSGSRSQGTPEEQAEKDKNFNPLDWNAWRKHI